MGKPTLGGTAARSVVGGVGVAAWLLTATVAAASHEAACDALSTQPGALYLYADSPAATFNGNNFAVSGYDVNFTDGLPGPAPDVWGIACRTDEGVAEILGSLSATQRNNVQGRDYVAGSPAIPSVARVEDTPSAEQVDAFIAALLSLPHVRFTSTSIVGNHTFGTQAVPLVTYFSNPDGVTFGNGNTTGYGIMIVEGSLTVRGNLDFVGLVLLRRSWIVDSLAAPTVWGGIWTGGDLFLGSYADVEFSSQGLAYARAAGGDAACGPHAPTPTPTGPTPTATPTLDRTPTPTPAPTLGCGLASATGCRRPTSPRRSTLRMTDAASDKSDRLVWTWTRGQTTVRTDFGDPTVATAYVLCVYDDTPSTTLAARVRAGGTCGERPCWKATRRGFKYCDRQATSGGIAALTLEAGAEAASTIRLKGKGVDLDMPALPLQQDTGTVVVQLKNDAGVCWEARYSAPALEHSTAEFRDASD